MAPEDQRDPRFSNPALQELWEFLAIVRRTLIDVDGRLESVAGQAEIRLHLYAEDTRTNCNERPKDPPLSIFLKDLAASLRKQYKNWTKLTSKTSKFKPALSELLDSVCCLEKMSKINDITDKAVAKEMDEIRQALIPLEKVYSLVEKMAQLSKLIKTRPKCPSTTAKRTSSRQETNMASQPSPSTSEGRPREIPNVSRNEESNNVALANPASAAIAETETVNDDLYEPPDSETLASAAKRRAEIQPTAETESRVEEQRRGNTTQGDTDKQQAPQDAAQEAQRGSEQAPGSKDKSNNNKDSSLKDMQRPPTVPQPEQEVVDLTIESDNDSPQPCFAQYPTHPLPDQRPVKRKRSMSISSAGSDLSDDDKALAVVAGRSSRDRASTIFSELLSLGDSFPRMFRQLEQHEVSHEFVDAQLKWVAPENVRGFVETVIGVVLYLETQAEDEIRLNRTLPAQYHGVVRDLAEQFIMQSPSVTVEALMVWLDNDNGRMKEAGKLVVKKKGELNLDKRRKRKPYSNFPGPDKRPKPES